jgi:hypothetical protein
MGYSRFQIEIFPSLSSCRWALSKSRLLSDDRIKIARIPIFTKELFEKLSRPPTGIVA